MKNLFIIMLVLFFSPANSAEFEEIKNDEMAGYLSKVNLVSELVELKETSPFIVRVFSYEEEDVCGEKTCSIKHFLIVISEFGMASEQKVLRTKAKSDDAVSVIYPNYIEKNYCQPVKLISKVSNQELLSLCINPY